MEFTEELYGLERRQMARLQALLGKLEAMEQRELSDELRAILESAFPTDYPG